MCCSKTIFSTNAARGRTRRGGILREQKGRRQLSFAKRVNGDPDGTPMRRAYFGVEKFERVELGPRDLVQTAAASQARAARVDSSLTRDSC
jgi:hypothetical protein